MTQEELIEKCFQICKNKKISSDAEYLASVMREFFSEHICIKKGANRHPDADVLHKLAENPNQELEFKLYSIWEDSYKWSEMSFRIKPQEPVYEWQWYYIENGEGINAGWMTHEEVCALHDDISNERDYYIMQETKRERK